MVFMFSEGLPPYETASGTVHAQIGAGYGRRLAFVENTTQEECGAYAQQLSQRGFALYSRRELPAGSGTEEKNTFYTYTAEECHVFLSWYPTLREARIVTAPPGLLPSLERPKGQEAEQAFVQNMTQFGLTGGGMQYIICLGEGEFVLLDGGYDNEADMQVLHDYLLEKTPRGRKPLIYMWLFSHGHQDHLQLATTFMSKYAKEVEIRSVAYNFPDAKKMDTKGREKDWLVVDCIAAMEAAVKDFFPKADRYALHAGQVYYFKGMELEIVQTQEELYPREARTWNCTSASWRVRFQNGETVLFLGDTVEKMSARLADVYGDYMKSDALQLAHHGLYGGNLGLYKLVDPAICLWPTDMLRFTGRWPKYTEQPSIGEGGCDYNGWIRDESVRKREHFCHEVTVTLFMEKQGIRCEARKHE